MNRRAAAALALALTSGLAAAQIHKWRDERGVTHYSADPPPGHPPAQILRSTPLPAPLPPPGSEALPRRPKSYPEMAVEARQERLFREERLRAERAERLRPQREAQAREARCRKARGEVRILESNRRVIPSPGGRAGRPGESGADAVSRQELLDQARAGAERNCVD